MKKSRLVQVNLLAQDHTEVSVAHWQGKTQIKRIFIAAYMCLLPPSTSELMLFLSGFGGIWDINNIIKLQSKCHDANGTFFQGGKTPSGIGIVATKAESEAVDILKVHGLELRGSQASLFICCAQPSLRSWAGTN